MMTEIPCNEETTRELEKTRASVRFREAAQISESVTLK
jgi:hypothetical protein